MGQKRLGSSLWRSHGEVAARSVDGGAYGATSLPLHHSLREQSPSPSLRDREDRQRPLATPKRTLRTILSASTLRSADLGNRSEEHTSELQSLIRISYAVFCLKTNSK